MLVFFPACWNVKKADIFFNMFYDFHKGIMKVNRINCGSSTLLHKWLMLPRYNNSDLYACLNAYISNMWITTLTIIVELVAANLTHRIQTTFMKYSIGYMGSGYPYPRENR